MNTATKLGAYVAALAVVFGGAAAIGTATGPVGEADDGGHGGHGSHGSHGGTPAGAAVPGGLQVSQGGYTLHPRTADVRPGVRTDFRFTIDGPDGRPVTRFTPLHGKRLHLIIARRDLSGFQHVHPTLGADGTWRIPLTFPAAGDYRVFADFTPSGDPAGGLTLGADVAVPGDYRGVPLPAPSRTAEVDGYTVTLNGDLATSASMLTLSVSRNGVPVTDLQPYLGAFGHLVALRQGDLAYLHVHPDGEPGDGKTKPGPDITFYAEAPSAGTYRLYLDFQHGGKVRTAEFTATAGPSPAPVQPDEGQGEGHGEHTH